VKPGKTSKEVVIGGATGMYSTAVNGVYKRTSATHCDKPVYIKEDGHDMQIEYDKDRTQWQLKDVAHSGNGGYALASIMTDKVLEDIKDNATSGTFWKVATKPKADRVSYKLNDKATDKKLKATPLKREDQVDFTHFTSVAAMIAFLSDKEQHKFIKYPPSLFRIICNRRMFLGTVLVYCSSKSEFLCEGLSALMSPGDEIVFDGELFGGVAAGVTYHLVALRRSGNKEFFSVSKSKGGEAMELQAHEPKQQDETARHSNMSVRASKRSLLHFLEQNDAWRLSFPATCIIHDNGGGDELRALSGVRPNLIATSSEEDCGAFAAFELIATLQEHE
jgi:hypothetical protein